MTDQTVIEGEKPEELTYAEQLITKNQYEEARQVLIKLEKKKNLLLTYKVACLTLQARILIWLGKFEDAIKKCEQTYEESLGLGKSLQILLPLILKALIYNWLGKFDKSFEIIKKSEDLFRTFNKGSSISSEYIATEAALNFIKGYLVSQKDPNRGLELLEYSLSLWDKIDLRIEKAMTIMCIGWVLYSSKGELDQSINHLKKALAIAEKINHKWGIAHLKSNLGNSYYLKGEINQSLKYYYTSLQLYQEISNKIQMAYTHSNIGGLLVEKGEFEEALKHLENSLVIFEEIGVIFGTFSPLGNAIEISLEIGDMDKTYKYFDNLKQIAEQFKRPVLDLYVVLIEAIILKKKQRTRDNAKAEELLKRILKESDISFSITIEALIQLSDLYLTELHMTSNLEILNEIIPLVEKLSKIAEKSHSHWIRGETYLLQAKLALVSLDLKGARRFLTQGQQIAEKYGLTLLARKISNEHDELLQKLNAWENLKDSDMSLVERMELARLNEQMGHMVRRRELELPDLPDEDPVVLLIISEGGRPVFSESFVEEWSFEDHLFGGFLTAVNSFSDEMFSEGLNRANFGEYTIIMNSLSPFLVCYLFKGQSYLAQQRVKKFIDNIKKEKNILKTFNEYNQTCRVVQLEDAPLLGSLISEIFLEKSVSKV